VFSIWWGWSLGCAQDGSTVSEVEPPPVKLKKRSAVTSEALESVEHFLGGVHDDAILRFQQGVV
jgi:hypothetical protein